MLDENKVLDLVTAAGALGEKVAADEAGREKLAAAVEERIPDVIASLVAHDRIGPGDREKVARILRDPVRTLDLIEKLAAHRAEPTTMGDPLPREKAAAAYDSLTSPHVGARTTQPRRSDAVFLEKLGLAAG